MMPNCLRFTGRAFTGNACCKPLAASTGRRNENWLPQRRDRAGHASSAALSTASTQATVPHVALSGERSLSNWMRPQVPTALLGTTAPSRIPRSNTKPLVKMGGFVKYIRLITWLHLPGPSEKGWDLVEATQNYLRTAVDESKPVALDTCNCSVERCHLSHNAPWTPSLAHRGEA